MYHSAKALRGSIRSASAVRRVPKGRGALVGAAKSAMIADSPSHIEPRYSIDWLSRQELPGNDCSTVAGHAARLEKICSAANSFSARDDHSVDLNVILRKRKTGGKCNTCYISLLPKTWRITGKRPAAREYNSLERETEWYLAQIPKERGKRTDLSPQGDKYAMIAHYCGFRKGVTMTPFTRFGQR